MTENVYPQIIPAGVVVKSVEETNAYIESKVKPSEEEAYKRRVDYLDVKYSFWKGRYEHFLKLKKWWGTGESISEYVIQVIVYISTATSIILPALKTSSYIESTNVSTTLKPSSNNYYNIPDSAIVASAAITLFANLIKDSVIRFIPARRKKINEQKCKIINEYLMKGFLISEKIKDDGVITTEEIEKYDKLFIECESKLKNITESNSNNSENDIDLEMQFRQKQIDAEAKSIVMNEMKEANLKKTIERYRTQLGLNVPSVSTVVSPTSVSVV